MAQSSSSERPRDWNETVKTAGYGSPRQKIRDKFYRESAGLMFRPSKEADEDKNYADEAIKNPAEYGLSTFDELRQSQISIIAEKVPQGMTISDYLMAYFRQVYEKAGKKSDRKQMWKEIYLTVSYMSHYEIEQYYDGDEAKIRPLNPDMVIQGKKVVIQNGRLTILHRERQKDGTIIFRPRLVGVPLRPGTGWQSPVEEIRQTEDYIVTNEKLARLRASWEAQNAVGTRTARVVAPRTRTAAVSAASARPVASARPTPSPPATPELQQPALPPAPPTTRPAETAGPHPPERPPTRPSRTEQEHHEEAEVRRFLAIDHRVVLERDDQGFYYVASVPAGVPLPRGITVGSSLAKVRPYPSQ